MTNHVLGILRLDLGRPPVNEGGLQLLWVVDFPLFEALDADGRPIPAHHPFTMPHPEDLELLDSSSGDDLLAVRSQAYDLVLNGWELGSGSVRIHSPVVQQKIFSFLGIEPEEAQARFGFLLDAFKYGAPPHAGFAFGVDRLDRAARGRGEHPRGHRVPEDPEGRGPPDRCAQPARPGAAHRARAHREAEAGPQDLTGPADGPRRDRPHGPGPVRRRLPARDVHGAAPRGAGLVAGADRAHARRRGVLGDQPSRRAAPGRARPGDVLVGERSRPRRRGRDDPRGPRAGRRARRDAEHVRPADAHPDPRAREPRLHAEAGRTARAVPAGPDRADPRRRRGAGLLRLPRRRRGRAAAPDDRTDPRRPGGGLAPALHVDLHDPRLPRPRARRHDRRARRGRARDGRLRRGPHRGEAGVPGRRHALRGRARDARR